MQLPRDDREHPRAEAFRDFIRNPPFPCVGAKSALSRGRMQIVVARDITSGWDDMRIYPALLAFVAMYFVGAEQGATSLLNGTAVHEWTHDGRHLLGFPCH